MRLDLAERLRCPRPHAATPLVIVASEVVERELRRGIAGCPVCRFEARFEGGDLGGDWSGAARVHAPTHSFEQATGHAVATAHVKRTAGASPSPAANSASLDRLIALLGLAEPGGAVLLTGEYAAMASALAQQCEVAVVTDQPRQGRALEDPVSAIVGFGDAIPFSDGTFRAAALGAGITPAYASDAVRCTSRGGRIVGAAMLPRPDGARELARDEKEWVAEVDARATVVEIKRRG